MSPPCGKRWQVLTILLQGAIFTDRLCIMGEGNVFTDVCLFTGGVWSEGGGQKGGGESGQRSPRDICQDTVN